MKLIRLGLVIVFLILFQGPVESGVLLNRVHFKAVGDIMVHDVQYRSVYDHKTGEYDFTPMFLPAKEALKADILVGNLETTLSGPEIGYSSYPRFNSPDNLATTLHSFGFNLLFTANNHSLDKGVKGLKRTIEVLRKNNVKHTGTFINPEDRDELVIITANGIRFGFLSYTYGTNGLLPPRGQEYVVNLIDIPLIQEDIEKAKGQVDMVVVGLHFGDEYQRQPNHYQRDIAYKVAEAGADIILGSHPHVLQPFEFIDLGDRETFVVYSLGNFVSGQKGRYKDSGAILELVIEKSLFDHQPKIVEVNFTPVWVRRFHHENRLRMEVIPYQKEITTQKILSNHEILKLEEVNNDVLELWAPINRRPSVGQLLGVWANVSLPISNPKSWFPLLLKN